MLSFPFCPIVIMNFFSLPLPLKRDSLATKTLQLKGQSNEIFYLQFFFIYSYNNSNLPGSLANEVKYLQFWLRIRRVVRIGIFQSPRGINDSTYPRRVTFVNLKTRIIPRNLNQDRN